MDTQAITVGPAPDHEAYLRTDQTVWFGEVGRESPDDQLLGVPARFRYAAQVAGADPETYPGIYGVRPMTLSIPGTGAGFVAFGAPDSPGWASIPTTVGAGC